MNHVMQKTLWIKLGSFVHKPAFVSHLFFRPQSQLLFSRLLFKDFLFIKSLKKMHKRLLSPEWGELFQ